MTTATADPFDLALNILDPPPWEPANRAPLEPHQVAPSDPFDLWLLEGGRGSGKTEACARFYAKYMRAHSGYRGRIIAPTYGDAVEACIEGPSGLLSMDPEITWLPSAPGGSKVVWPNGSEALVLGTHSPRDVDRLRAGGNRHIDWWEEMAANAQLKDAWDQAAFGLRLGPNPIAIASTTPRNIEAYVAIRKMDGCIRTHATIYDNPHLSDEWKAKQAKRYEGTRLAKQELMGELIEDVEGALWTRKMIERSRVQPDEFNYKNLIVAAVAIDPAATSGPNSDDTGIVAGGLGPDGEAYILHDRTCHLPPAGWGKRAVRTYKQIDGDYVVGEVNNGGEMVEHVIATTDPRVPFKPVRASRGKQTRAQPVSSLYGDEKRMPRVHHVGFHPELEDQMCTWVPDEGDPSPDRMDALVWLVTQLMLADEEEDEVVEFYEPVRIGADI